MRLSSEEQKREVIRRKKILKGKKNYGRLNMERKMKWKLEEIARREEGKGKKVWLSYGKIRIGGFGRRGSRC